MRKAKDSIDLSEDVDALSIAEKAKRVLQGFLNTECSPNAYLSPRDAESLRRSIMDDVRIAVESRSGTYPNVSTGAIAHELSSVAESQKQSKRPGPNGKSGLHPDLLESLAEMFRNVASPRSKKKRKG